MQPEKRGDTNIGCAMNPNTPTLMFHQRSRKRLQILFVWRIEPYRNMDIVHANGTHRPSLIGKGVSRVIVQSEVDNDFVTSCRNARQLRFRRLA